MLAVLAAAHSLAYVAFTRGDCHPCRYGEFVGTDSLTYIAAAQALLDGSYSTPLKAGFLRPDYLNLDITGLEIPAAARDAPERQAFRTPGYPLFLAATGGGSRGAPRYVSVLAQALLFGVGAWLLALTLRRWWEPRTALLGTALYALDPWSKHYVSLLLTEVLAGVLAIATAYVFTRSWQEGGLRRWAAGGVLAACLTLVRPVFVLVVPLLVLAALVKKGAAGDRLARAGALLACSAVLIAPWLAWSKSVTGKVDLQSYGEGYNLLLAAHGEGRGRPESRIREDPAFRRDLRSAYRLAPSLRDLLTDPDAHPRYLAEADSRYGKLARSLYRKRLEEDPGQVLWEVAYRTYFLWNAHRDWYQPGGAALLLLRLVDWATIALGAAGIAVAIRRGGGARGVAIFLVLYSVVLGTHHVEARFAMPVRGLFLGFAALSLAELARLAARPRLRAAAARPTR